MVSRICICYILWLGKKEEPFFIKIYVYLFILSKGVETSVICETDGRWGRQVRLPYWPITSSLNHSTLCYLQYPLNTSSASRPGLLNRRPLRATAPSRAFSLTASWLSLWPPLSPTLSTGGRPTGDSSNQRGALSVCKLALTLAFTVSNGLNCRGHLHILFQNAHFWLDLGIFFRLFTQVHLWLMAWSRVNM